MEAKNPYRQCQDDYCVNLTCLDNKVSATAWEEGLKAGIKEVVEWVKANASLEHGDRDVGLCFEDYLHFDYMNWQDKLKEWGIRRG